ncbi:L-threonylcarbamoyladenylate synthase [Desulfuromonas thiophila]|jgi:tRNA threonylcarbamoyl adenosine modification protein (Sua5/YciO/YrdC/YwlC family)|uniref:Translation factor SUA5 n=1 Tax=Desulfuromonas thiophila TaxID=57664 RepID=A0A1G7C3F5_9BACT|nr:L-threonylcarbamoyladenylate synthase [Desulfuromonas thiophila]MCK9171979.1 L-threonylcarbamoyladenylate synthase [Desulfuromonas thiophila]MDD3801899.1 L-threonylcarbamoyladenylate synthase [Desulfuromonas thiophila]MDY0398563.1 L-threonylcarbamoyladenylate synthase [Desulfuromonas thiophila]SDE33841.1 translation factor SUA5 [Desulfuromonas thiophila]
MILHINPDNPQARLIDQAVDCLRNGGVIAYPTDTIYGIGCAIFNRKSIQRIYQIKQRDPRKPFSFICSDLAEVARYARVSNQAFKIMKRHLPGAYTFVLDATREVPELLVTRQRTVGVRIPANNIALEIVRRLGEPLVTTSANLTGEATYQDPSLIHDDWGKQLDLVIDGGLLHGEPSTVISLRQDQIEILRQGCGATDWIHQLL